MQKFTLVRSTEQKEVTLGRIIDEQGAIICYTLEQPWRENKINISCIPTGVYKCKSFSGRIFKNVWELLDVDNRDGILIHNGNYAINTKGCILVGNKYTEYMGVPMVNDSVNTLNRMREFMPREFELEIRWENDSYRANPAKDEDKNPSEL